MDIPPVVSNPLIEKKSLFVPTLDEVAKVLQDGLKSNFAQVEVKVVDCPDLTQKPFTLACKGLGGNPSVVEVGGVPYLLPLVKREKLYDFKDVARWSEINPAFIIGACAGPWPYAGVNCEMMANLSVSGNDVDNHTRIAKINTNDDSCILEILPNTETRIALLANLFLSEGKPGKVLQVHCKTRTGNDDFIASIRKTLQDHYKEKAVGLGGTFVLKEAKAKQHIMPDFSTVRLNSDQDVENWLHFYNQSPPLVAVGTLVSADPGLDLRVQHFHSFSHHGEGGHYHIDTEPASADYLGYFALGEQVVRIDRPVETHDFGRD
ncbi:hypothetical protein R5R35_012270 [Gryllus longicercus]|uniref:DUF1907 domain-containing protein n=1 Tax=Gryllus longicercus TaxID=2509291 RepID=A0AAN9VV68_9ORTH